MLRCIRERIANKVTRVKIEIRMYVNDYLFNPILDKYQAENQVHTQYQQQYIAIFFHSSIEMSYQLIQVTNKRKTN